MFPKDDPEIIMFVSYKRPKNGSNRGLKNMAHSIIESIAKYKGLISDKKDDNDIKTYEIKDYTNLDKEDVLKKLDGLDVVVLGNGNKIIDQYPKKATLVTNDKIFLLTNDKNIKMPDLKGYSRIEAISILNLLDIDYEIEGYGYVTEQSIKAGSDITNKIKLILKQDE